MKKSNTVDEYIAASPKETRETLEKVRHTIKKAAPNAKEVISYQMPAYKIGCGRPIIFFAGFKHHIGLYPLPSAIETFKSEISKYKTGKGSIQFPLDKPIPYQLIKKIVEYRIKEKN